ncbi:MAG: AraC family transcriptional regulator [Lachnospiraceae bacterium]|nr:AraC family transcriptional regulator [Lachnospiraceae bacterium]
MEKKVEEFRYYEMPMGRYDRALLGEKWITNYRTGEQHFHNFYEVGYCYFGEGVVFLGEDAEKYGAGSISLIPSNFPHGIHNAEDDISSWEFLYLDLAGFIEKCYADDEYRKLQVLQQITRFPIMITIEEQPRLAAVISAILEENREQQVLNREAVNGYLYVMIQELIRLNEHIALEHEKEILHIEKIRPALVHIELHYHEDLKIKELAGICNISEPYFRRLFGSCMKVSPLEYINIIRIQKACELLQKEDVSMSSLAWKTGYSSVSTFERNFKKIVGESPKKWRLRAKDDKEFVSYRTRVLKGW